MSKALNGVSQMVPPSDAGSGFGEDLKFAAVNRFEERPTCLAELSRTSRQPRGTFAEADDLTTSAEDGSLHGSSADDDLDDVAAAAREEDVPALTVSAAAAAPPSPPHKGVRCDGRLPRATSPRPRVAAWGRSRGARPPTQRAARRNVGGGGGDGGNPARDAARSWPSRFPAASVSDPSVADEASTQDEPQFACAPPATWQVVVKNTFIDVCPKESPGSRARRAHSCMARLEVGAASAAGAATAPAADAALVAAPGPASAFAVPLPLSRAAGAAAQVSAAPAAPLSPRAAARPSLPSEATAAAAVEPAPQQLDTKSRFSAGSQLHGTVAADGQAGCQPCAWFFKDAGCHNGTACRFCHLCPKGEMKTRKRQKVARLRGEEGGTRA